MDAYGHGTLHFRPRGESPGKKGLFWRGRRVKLSKTGPQDTDRQTNDNLFCHSRAPFKPSSRRHRRGPSFFPSFPLYNSPRWRYGAGALLARTSDAFSSTIRTDVSLTTKCVETVVRLSRRVPSLIGSTCRVKVCWRATVASALDRGNVICPAHRSSKTLLGVFYAPASVPSTSWLTRSRVPWPEARLGQGDVHGLGRAYIVDSAARGRAVAHASGRCAATTAPAAGPRERATERGTCARPLER